MLGPHFKGTGPISPLSWWDQLGYWGDKGPWCVFYSQSLTHDLSQLPCKFHWSPGQPSQRGLMVQSKCIFTIGVGGGGKDNSVPRASHTKSFTSEPRHHLLFRKHIMELRHLLGTSNRVWDCLPSQQRVPPLPLSSKEIFVQTNMKECIHVTQ